MTPLRIFIGYDSRESVAFHVLTHSILRRATIPVAIVPLVRHQLAHVYVRPRGPLESTDFSFTRFLVPYLCGYQGHAVFMDCDMLCLADIAELWREVERQMGVDPWWRSRAPVPRKAVLVCQHPEYTPRTSMKMDGQVQTAYPRKNWSSLMVFDAAACWALTPHYVNTAPAVDLHRLAWAEGDARIGALPLEWNWLVGEYAPNAEAKVLHYTLGGPWFAQHRECDHADLWLAEAAQLQAVA